MGKSVVSASLSLAPWLLPLRSRAAKAPNRRISRFVRDGAAQEQLRSSLLPCWGALNLSFRTLVDQYLANYEDADFVAA